MRRERYVTNDTLADTDKLTNLIWAVDQKNIVNIRWSWPRNGGIKLAAIFTAENAEDGLETLLTRQEPIVITKDMDKHYNRPLDMPRAIYRVFPALFGEGSDVVILNQADGNTTDVIKRVVTVYYKIGYKNLPLSDYRRVDLSIKCAEAHEPELAYTKLRADMRVCDYPIGRGEYVCYVKRNETISLYAADECVLLIEEKS